jgi:hypothetical protein
VIALGWRQLAEISGRQVIMGSVTQPWRQEMHFHGLRAEEFVALCEPGYAKIAWTIEVEPAGLSSSVFFTETRVVTTDPVSRERFRRYWALLSPGIPIMQSPHVVSRSDHMPPEISTTRIELSLVLGDVAINSGMTRSKLPSGRD